MRLRSAIAFDSFVLFAAAGDTLLPAFILGENARAFARLRLRKGEGMVGWVADTTQSIVNGNPLVDDGYKNEPAELVSALAVPLQAAGATVGVLALYHTKAAGFSSEDLKVLNACREHFALLLAGYDSNTAPRLDHGTVYVPAPVKDSEAPALAH